MSGSTAIKTALEQGRRQLNEMFQNKVENLALVAFWNDVKSRDARARLEGSFDHGRFEFPKPTIDWPSACYYCCYTRLGMNAQGLPLDLEGPEILDLAD